MLADSKRSEGLAASELKGEKKSHMAVHGRTGETCPESGVWQVVAPRTTTAPIAKGNRMPPYNGAAVTWRLISYA